MTLAELKVLNCQYQNQSLKRYVKQDSDIDIDESLAIINVMMNVVL